MFNQRLFPKCSAYAKTVAGAPLQTHGCPRHDFSIVWEHRWLTYSVLGGLHNVLAREALEREGTQAPILHLSVNGEPGSHVTHHNRRREVSVVNPPSLGQGTGSPVWGQQAGPNKTLHLQIIDFFCWPPTLASGQFGAETNCFHKCFRVFCGALALKNIKWVYEKGKQALPASKHLAKAESGKWISLLQDCSEPFICSGVALSLQGGLGMYCVPTFGQRTLPHLCKRGD